MEGGGSCGHLYALQEMAAITSALRGLQEIRTLELYDN